MTAQFGPVLSSGLLTSQETVDPVALVNVESGDRPRRVDGLSDGALAGARARAWSIESREGGDGLNSTPKSETIDGRNPGVPSGFKDGCSRLGAGAMP